MPGDAVLGLAGASVRWLATLAIVAGGAVFAWGSGRLAGLRVDDPHGRYHARKLTHYVVGLVIVVALAIVWRAFAGRAGVVLGFATAGIAFAMQEVIGALAGWFNILSGRIFRVGDRIEMGGVRGDVIDVTLLRTKLMEIGSDASEDQGWVHGRQFTGRIVTVSNKATFTDPVFNYSASFGFLWEEMAIPVSFESDWERASEIIGEAALAMSAGEQAEDAIERMRRTYPVPRAELRPRVLAVPTDNYMQLTARFIVPVRTARLEKDRLARDIVERLQAEGIEVASSTEDVRVDLRQHGTDGAGDDASAGGGDPAGDGASAP